MPRFLRKFLLLLPMFCLLSLSLWAKDAGVRTFGKPLSLKKAEAFRKRSSNPPSIKTRKCCSKARSAMCAR